MGYFLYYYLYAGNWAYYFSGAWARQNDQLSQLLDPGLYLFGRPVAIPKLVAVPLVLGLFTALGVWLGRGIEAWWRRRQRRQGLPVAATLIRHRVFVVATFLVFNVFFLFAGRPLLLLLPAWVQYLFDVSLVAASTLWLYHAWRRSPELYSRENLASRFRRQLERLDLDVARFLDGRSIAELSTHEVYVLAKVLPGFTREKRLEAYKGVVREALEEGYVNVASSLEVLQQMRLELGVADDEHQQVLEELGVEDPSLLDPDRRRSLEDQIRLSGYRKALERLMLLQRRQADPEAMQSLRREFSVSDAEETMLLGGLSPTAGAAHRAEALLDRLPALCNAYRVVQQPELPLEPELRRLLADTLRGRCELNMGAILAAFTALGAESAPVELAARLRRLEPEILSDLLARESWTTRLEPRLLDQLAPGNVDRPAARTAGTPAETLHHLETLVQDPNPLVQAGALLLIARLDPQRGQALARDACGVDAAPLLRATAERLQPQARDGDGTAAVRLADIPELEKRVFLASSDFFHGTHNLTLDALAEAAELRRFAAGELITEAGDTCRELLLLIEGEASVRYGDDQDRRDPLRAGQVLDELEVLTHSTSENTIVADHDGTRMLAVPVHAFDAILDRDPDFARRVLELESRQLQQFMRSVRS
ncbi:cyclic nucleotide-binding domain-containing protein [Synechococcus sp. GFB01]|uniref:cyclic nucleotide-binding domain-containing protein n=1 Tax=Synechococcus sp. GFB01 TaxID=1662190 RepID=UPI00069E7369|nr:cyclic nucleotide-binding domain-containing protein [Synechococcus sp. GFB01]